MILLWKIFFFSFLTGAILFTAWVLFYPKPVPQTEQQALQQVFVLMQDGHYDKAAQLLGAWINNANDPSRDLYIRKAYKQSKTTSESIEKAAWNLDKAQNLLDKRQNDDLALMLFELGRAYAILGDLSNQSKCQFYKSAIQDFDKQLTLVKGDPTPRTAKRIRLKSSEAKAENT
jgi:tetratricopeptide (TPR) repeat protein